MCSASLVTIKRCVAPDLLHHTKLAGKPHFPLGQTRCLLGVRHKATL